MKIALGFAGIAVAAFLLAVQWPTGTDGIEVAHVFLVLWALAAAVWSCDVMGRFRGSSVPALVAASALLAATLMQLAAPSSDGTLVAMAVPLLVGLAVQAYRRGRRHGSKDASTGSRLGETV